MANIFKVDGEKGGRGGKGVNEKNRQAYVIVAITFISSMRRTFIVVVVAFSLSPHDGGFVVVVVGCVYGIEKNTRKIANNAKNDGNNGFVERVH